MLFLGPIVRRDLILLLRRGSPWTERAAPSVILVLVLIGWVIKWAWEGRDWTSIEGGNQFVWEVFGLMVGVQLAYSALYMISLTAAPIALERDRKTLDALLATELTATEIVLGTLMSALIRIGTGWLALVPVGVALIWLGGIDLRVVGLAAAGVAATTALAASIGVVCSVEARTASRAGGWVVFWLYTWLGLPAVLVILAPRVWTLGATYLVPIASPFLASSPIGVGLSVVLGLIPRGSLVSAVTQMIGLQAVGVAVLIGWAIVRLRPAARRAAGWSGWAEWRRGRRTSGRVRPACGNDLILWREMYPARTVGPLARRVAQGFSLITFGLLIYVTSWFAGPAFAELWASGGYGPRPGPPITNELNPIARVLINKLLGFPGATVGPGQARLDFNAYLRMVTLGFESIYLITLLGMAAESVAAERDRDTWPGLLVTPLTGREILRGKLLGVLWRVRWFLIVLGAFWLVGTLSGAVHPVGVLAAVVILGVSSWFVAVAGVTISLHAPNRQKAVAWTLLPLMGMTLLSVFGFLAPGVVGAIPAACLPAFAGWATLFSYDDIRDLTAGGPLATLAAVRLTTSMATWLVLGIATASLAAQAVAAGWLARLGARRFDAVVGRPTRGQPTDPIQPQIKELSAATPARAGPLV